MRNDSKHKYYTSMCPWGFGDLEWTVGIKNKSSGSQMQFLWQWICFQFGNKS